MSVTIHYNFTLLPSTGAVDWPVVINAALDKIEAGRTLRLTAGENLAKGYPFYIKTADGKAWKADDTTGCRGIWQSTSTLANAEGFGQIDGIMTTGSWTIGTDIWPDTGGTLTQTQPSTLPAPVGYAMSATIMVIQPQS